MPLVLRKKISSYSFFACCFFFFCEEAGVVHFCIKQAVIVYVVGEVWWQDNGRVYEYVG